MRIGDILNQDYNIPRHYIEEIYIKQQALLAKGTKMLFGDIAISSGLISDELIYKALAEQQDINFIPFIEAKDKFNLELYKEKWLYEQFGNSYEDLISSIELNNMFPAQLKIDGNDIILIVAIGDIKALDEMGGIVFTNNLEKLIEKDENKIESYLNNLESTENPPITKIEYIFTTPSIFELFFLKYKGITIPEIKSLNEKVALSDEDNRALVDNSSNLIKLEVYLQSILTYAIINEVSDIHFEPSLNNQFRISVRKQGFRQTLDFVESELASRLIALIKTKSNMDSQNIRSPQDGMLDGSQLLLDYKLPIKRGLSKVNPIFDFHKNSFRISTYPTVRLAGGNIEESFESVVVRVLSSNVGNVELSTLGLSEGVERELLYATSRNQGIILMVGPTGSGKSTTLYSALSKIDPIKTKIISFEDPVEIRNLYWAQAEKKEVDSSLTFGFLEAKKSILRQDPDVILMGEVRDEESAMFAIEASNTGHLVLTTLHANTASASFERLVKLGAKPIELATSILAIISQRLVRQVCPKCSTVREINDDEKLILNKLEYPESKWPKEVRVAHMDGCNFCNHTGYIGRTLLDEVIPISSKVKEAIIDQKPDFIIREIVSDLGYNTMLDNGFIKMKEGIVTFDDVVRVQ
jgi:type IV pilus assembly protein PilB